MVRKRRATLPIEQIYKGKDRILKRSRRKANGCLIFKGSLDYHGYGRINLCGVIHSAHRVILSAKLGRILKREECALHKCDTPACVNANCLFIGNHQMNSIDMANKGRGRNQKITPKQALLIRELLVTGLLTHKQIAMLFKVSKPTISHIASRRIWAHL